MGVKLGHHMEFSWEIFNWTPTQRYARDFGQEVLNGPQLGDLEGDLVIKFEWV